jgi:chemotaxis protein CheD
MAGNDAKQKTPDVSIGMGQVETIKSPGCLKAILGSCVAIVLYHPRQRVGALAHVVLPKSAGQSGSPGKFADTAVPHMLAMLKEFGVNSSGLVAKLAGGANMFGTTGPLQIGDKNIQAAIEALSASGITVDTQDVGGKTGRRVTLSTATGALTIESAGRPPLII